MRTSRNVFRELGIPQEKIDKKIAETFDAMFYGDEDTRIYHPVGPETSTHGPRVCLTA